MAIFNSYVKLPEGRTCWDLLGPVRTIMAESILYVSCLACKQHRRSLQSSPRFESARGIHHTGIQKQPVKAIEGWWMSQLWSSKDWVMGNSWANRRPHHKWCSVDVSKPYSKSTKSVYIISVRETIRKIRLWFKLISSSISDILWFRKINVPLLSC